VQPKKDIYIIPVNHWETTMTDQSFPTFPSSESAIAPMERASFWQRLFAFVIDTVVLSIIVGCISLAGLPNRSLGGNEQFQGWWSAAWVIIQGVIPAIYYIYSYSTSGQTLGKHILKIKVVSIDGSPLNWAKGLIRTIGYITSSIPLNLGFLWSLGNKERQAWHDKMAVTYVVPANIKREQFQGTIEPLEVRRRQKPWLLGLGIPTILILIVGYSTSIIFINRKLAEVREMGPWPGIEIRPGELITVDLSHLGLELGQVQNARDQETWANGSYEEGVLVTYVAEAKDVVAIWALRYKDDLSASNDYRSVQAYAAEAGVCGRNTYAYKGNTGVIHCQFSDAYQKLFWKDNRIVSILALEGTGLSPEILVDQVRDAIAAHWLQIQSP